MFINCTFENSMESALHAFDSRLIFQSNNTFRNNSALVGAGIYLLQSYLHVHPHTNILFENNHAVYVGGAIYTEDQPCFFDLDLQRVYKTINVNFVNNTAGSTGSALYGGIDCCDNQPCEGFHSIFNIYNSEDDPSAITSSETDGICFSDRICFCEEKKHRPNCSLPDVHYIRAFPGQVFPVRLAVLGRSPFDGVVFESTRAFFEPSTNATLESYQISQAATKASCENFNYTV